MSQRTLKMGSSGIKFLKNTVFQKFVLLFNILLLIYGMSHLINKNSESNDEIITSHIQEPKFHNENYRKILESDMKESLCDCSQCPRSSDTVNPSDLGRNFYDKNRTLNVIKRYRNKPVIIGEDIDPSKTYQVPNIVHYIWFNTEPAEFKFLHMLSVLSASKFIRPDVIYFHTDNEPIGKFWEKTKTKVPELKIMKRVPPTRLFGEDVKPPHFYTSHSNVDRLKVLMEYGGIYLDFDVFVIRSFDDLRKHAITIGFESDEKSCGSIIVSSKNAFFLILWINSYLDDYRIEEWAYNTGKVPFKLANRYPHLVHVEKSKLNRPNFNELNLLYGDKTWNWKQNYAVHTWYRLWKEWSGMFKGIEPNMTNIKTLNNTFGQIARTVLYNSPDIKV